MGMMSVFGLLIVMIIALVVTVGVSAAVYIIGALGVYTLAKRRNMDKPWLAWLPVGQEYLLGKMSDDISMEEPPFKNYKWMLWYPIVAGAYLLVQFIDLGVQLTALPGIMEYAMLTMNPEGALNLLATSGGVLAMVTSTLATFVSIGLSVIGGILLYRVYKRYSPRAAIAFAICGSIFGLHWLFLFIIRKKQPLFAHYPQNAYGAPMYYNVPPQNPNGGMQ